MIGSGQNVAPVPIELEMKKELKLCAFCVVVGEGREYFNMLVTVKSKLSPLGAPTDELDEEAVAICKGLGVELTKVSEAMESAEVKQYIQEGINKANEKAINHQYIIQVSWSNFLSSGMQMQKYFMYIFRISRFFHSTLLSTQES